MPGVTERLGERALARFGAAGGEDLEAIAHRIATLLVAAVRLAAMPVGGLLMREGDARPASILLVGIVGCLWVGLSTSVVLRGPAGSARSGPLTFAGDIVVLTVGMALSGGVESPVRLLLVPLPIAAALVLTPRAVVGAGGALLAGFALLERPGEALGILTLQVIWAVAVGAGVSRQRETSLRRLSGIDEVRRSVLSGDLGHERRDLGVELRDAALQPLTAVARRLPHAGPTELRQLTEQVADAARRLRSVVVELHVLTARQGGLRGSLEGLAQRRSAGASLRVAAPPKLEDAELVLVTGLVRDALRAVARPTSTAVAIEVARVAPERLVVEVRALPAPPQDPEGLRAAKAFVQRARLAGGRAPTVEGGVARVALGDEELAAAPSWAPARSLQDSRLLIGLVRGPGVLAGLLSALVAGGPTPTFYVAGALALLWTYPIMVTAAAPNASFRRWVLVTAPDLVFFGIMGATVGPALEAVLPIVVAIAPGYGLQVSPVLTGVTNLLIGTTLVVAGVSSVAFLAAFGWSVAVALLLAVGVTTLDLGLVRLARIRRELVRRVAAEQERGRRGLAERIHDDTLQTLLAARQDLEEAAEGDLDGRARAREGIDAAIESLGRVAGDLDLDVDADALPDGPHGALSELATAVAQRGGPRVHVTLDPGAVGHHDGLVVRLAHELVANAVTHAEADRVELRLSRQDEDVVLDVVDDGCGVDPARVRDAVDRGHIGLASCRERVAMTGGSLVVEDGRDGGTRVRVRLPLRDA